MKEIIVSVAVGLLLTLPQGVQPTPAILPVRQTDFSGFSICNGKPCFMGIVPEETGMDEALNILKPYLNQPLSDQLPTYLEFDTGTVRGRIGTVNDGNNTVEYLEFDGFSTDFILLGDVVLRFGDPCYVVITDTGSGMIQASVTYENAVIIVVVPSTGTLSKQQPITSLALLHVTNSCGPNANIPKSSRWHGFASVQSYR